MCRGLQGWCSSEQQSDLIDGILLESRAVAAREKRRRKLEQYTIETEKAPIFADAFDDFFGDMFADLLAELFASLLVSPLPCEILAGFADFL